MVIVAISGQLIAYDINTGKQRWSGTDGGESYSSAHLMTIDGVKQLIFLNKNEAAGYLPANGKILWSFKWDGSPIIQPAQINNNDILISSCNLKDMHRISLKNAGGKWKTETQWTTTDLKPYFNDIILHKGMVYGFDGPYLVCIDVESGKLKWKGGRYSGELLLLADQDLLVVLSEKGKLACVKADAEGFKELSSIQVLEGKTWNHPVLVGNVLVVRNSQEMVAFKLSTEGS
jgi:outer membrane protein assembly factor BamB